MTEKIPYLEDEIDARLAELREELRLAEVELEDRTSRLAEMRTLRGWSQAELARQSGVHKTLLSRYECGYIVPTIETTRKLAKALDCAIDDIV